MLSEPKSYLITAGKEDNSANLHWPYISPMRGDSNWHTLCFAFSLIGRQLELGKRKGLVLQNRKYIKDIQS